MSILAVAALICGILYGASGADIPFISAVSSRSELILCILMFSVGISIGFSRGIWAKIREYNIKILIIPAGVVAASVLGGAVCSIITGYSLQESLSVACGLGWYSLSGVTITNLAGANLGSIAFLSNLMRELFSFFSIPFLSRHFNSYSCIAAAGATSEDTTLPMMIRYTDEESVVLSVLNGIICSALVPVLISLCYKL